MQRLRNRLAEEASKKKKLSPVEEKMQRAVARVATQWVQQVVIGYVAAEFSSGEFLVFNCTGTGGAWMLLDVVAATKSQPEQRQYFSAQSMVGSGDLVKFDALLKSQGWWFSVDQLLAVDQSFSFAFKVTDVEFGVVTEAERAAVSTYDAIAFDPVRWHDRAAMQSLAVNDLINVIVYVSFLSGRTLPCRSKVMFAKLGGLGKVVVSSMLLSCLIRILTSRRGL